MATGLPDEASYCCAMMSRQLRQRCEQHASRWDCPDQVVIVLRDGTYGLPVRTGENASASSVVSVWHCPWCAVPLPGHQDHVPGVGPGPVLPKATTADEIDRRVDGWHNGAGSISELHDFLGWTWTEYRRWVDHAVIPEP